MPMDHISKRISTTLSSPISSEDFHPPSISDKRSTLSFIPENVARSLRDPTVAARPTHRTHVASPNLTGGSTTGRSRRDAARSTVRGSVSSLFVSHLNSQPKPIWKSMLAQAGVSKTIPTRNILILGSPGTGKSTLAHHFERLNGDDTNSQFQHPSRKPRSDLGMSYSYYSVYDDDHEDVLSRVGVYQLSSTSPSHRSVLPITKSRSIFNSSLVMIVLDWTKPWEFLDELERWLNTVISSVQDYVKKEMEQEGTRKDEMETGGDQASPEGEEENMDMFTLWTSMQRKLHMFWQQYQEPPTEVEVSSTPITTLSSHTIPPPTQSSYTVPFALQELLDLPKGCLSNNIGIPLIIVCTKSDHMAQLSRNYNFKDDIFDFIQQVLRLLCFKLGAALFYTSTQTTSTISVLNQYILHRLMPNSFTYPYRAQIIERSTVRVPSGWDSWTKIQLLNETFNCPNWYDADELLPTNQDMSIRLGSGKEIWMKRIRDPESGAVGGAAHNYTPEAAENEQDFLKRLSMLFHSPAPNLTQRNHDIQTVHNFSPSIPAQTNRHIPVERLQLMQNAATYNTSIPMADVLPSTPTKPVILHDSGAVTIGHRPQVRDVANAHSPINLPGPKVTGLKDFDSPIRQAALEANALGVMPGSAPPAFQGQPEELEMAASFFQNLLEKKGSATPTPGYVPNR